MRTISSRTMTRQRTATDAFDRGGPKLNKNATLRQLRQRGSSVSKMLLPNAADMAQLEYENALSLKWQGNHSS